MTKNEKERNLHPARVAENYHKLSKKDKKKLIDDFNAKKLAILIKNLSPEEKNEVAEMITKEALEEVFSNLASDEIVDVLGDLSVGKSKRILNFIKKEDAETIKELMKYEEDTAGSLMATEYIGLRKKATVKEAIEKIKEISPHTEIIGDIYIVDDSKRLVGRVSIRDLFTHSEDMLLEEFMNTDIVSTDPHEDQEVVARKIIKYGLLAIPVINSDSKLVGIITADDVLNVVEKEATEDILKMAGAGYKVEEKIRSKKLLDDNLLSGIKLRLPWLLLALLGGLAAGGVIGFFEETLSTVIALAFFIPVIMDMAGNVGTQSSTIFIRGLALDQIKEEEFLKYLLSELKIGLTIGVVSGVLVGLLAGFWEKMILGVVVGTAMFLSIVFATLLGFLIPWIIYKLDWDPATGTGPVITTIKDITSLLIYFTIANILLSGLL